jgi:hypothetical protein
VRRCINWLNRGAPSLHKVRGDFLAVRILELEHVILLRLLERKLLELSVKDLLPLGFGALLILELAHLFVHLAVLALLPLLSLQFLLLTCGQFSLVLEGERFRLENGLGHLLAGTAFECFVLYHRLELLIRSQWRLLLLTASLIHSRIEFLYSGICPLAVACAEYLVV